MKSKAKEVKEVKKIKKDSVSIVDWIMLGVALSALCGTSVWAFVLTSRSVNANITVEGLLVMSGVLVNIFSVQAILKVVKR